MARKRQAKTATVKPKPKTRQTANRSPNRFLDISSAEYHSLDLLSNSMLRLFARDPEEYAAVHVHKTRVQRPPSSAQQFGQQVEDWLFRGRLPGVVLLPQHLSGRDGRKGAEFRELKMANIGKRFLTIEQAEKDESLRPFFEIAANVENHALADLLLYQSDAVINQAVQWKDARTGIMRRGELDLYAKGNFIADLKTAREIDRDSFCRDSYEYEYHWQMATYQDAIYAITGEWLPCFWIVVKNSAGYGVEVYEADDEQLALGRMEYRQALDRWRLCVSANNWRTATFGSAVQLGLPYHVAARGVAIKIRGKTYWIR